MRQLKHVRFFGQGFNIRKVRALKLPIFAVVCIFAFTFRSLCCCLAGK